MAQTIGSALTPVTTRLAKRLSLALHGMQQLMALQAIQGGSPKTLYCGDPGCRVFAMTSAPSTATATSANSPGQDLCIIIDTANNDAYLVYGWSAADTYTCKKILD